MNDDSARHQRRSIRLQGYDYAQAGAYFVTICTQQKACLFGKIVHGEMQLNEAGKMIHTVWHQLPMRFDTLALDEFVVMPNHIHGILVLQEGDCKNRTNITQNNDRGGESCICPESCIRPHVGGGTNDGGDHKDRPYVTRDADRGGESGIRPFNQPNKSFIRPRGTLPDTVGRIVQAFKSITTHAYITGVKQQGWPPFAGKLWQRNYWEHIIRNESDWHQIREYIHNNPLQWELDKLNPECREGRRES